MWLLLSPARQTFNLSTFVGDNRRLCAVWQRDACTDSPTEHITQTVGWWWHKRSESSWRFTLHSLRETCVCFRAQEIWWRNKNTMRVYLRAVCVHVWSVMLSVCCQWCHTRVVYWSRRIFLFTCLLRDFSLSAEREKTSRLWMKTKETRVNRVCLCCTPAVPPVCVCVCWCNGGHMTVDVLIVCVICCYCCWSVLSFYRKRLWRLVCTEFILMRSKVKAL